MQRHSLSFTLFRFCHRSSLLLVYATAAPKLYSIIVQFCYLFPSRFAYFFSCTKINHVKQNERKCEHLLILVKRKYSPALIIIGVKYNHTWSFIWPKSSYRIAIFHHYSFTFLNWHFHLIDSSCDRTFTCPKLSCQTVLRRRISLLRRRHELVTTT